MKIITAAVMPKEKMKEYTLKIARGEIKPKQGAPKIFFPSMRAMSEALVVGSSGFCDYAQNDGKRVQGKGVLRDIDDFMLTRYACFFKSYR